MWFLFLLILFFSISADGQSTGAISQTAPELPHNLIATTLNATNYADLFSSPVMKAVKSSGGDYTSLQAAFNGISTDAPNCGEIITVDAGYTSDSPGNGVTVTYSTVCPANKHVWVRSGNYLSLPVQGTRVAVGDQTNMFIIAKSTTSDTGVPGFTVSDGATGLIITGMKMTLSGTAVSGFFWAGSQTNSSGFCSRVILDRNYFDTTYSTMVHHAIYDDCSWFAMVDSVVDHVQVPHTDSCNTYQDTQDFAQDHSPGPTKVVNNYFGGAPTENVIFGGAFANNSGVNQTDLEIRRNTIIKDTNQLANSAIKNLFEIKNAVRAIFDGNLAQWSYEDASACGGQQHGQAIDLVVTVNVGGCPQCTASDITFTNNDVQHFSRSFLLEGHSGVSPTQNPVEARMLIQNNLFRDQNWNTYDPNASDGGHGGLAISTGTAPGGQFSTGPYNVTFDHNGIYGSATNTSYSVFFNDQFGGPGGSCSGGPIPNFTFTNNAVVTDGTFGSGKSSWGGCGMAYTNSPDGLIGPTGNAAAPTLLPGLTVSGNVLFDFVVSSGTTCSAAHWLTYNPGVCPPGQASSPSTINSTLGIADYANCASGTMSYSACIITNGNGSLGLTATPGPNIAAIQAAQIEPNDSLKWGARTPN